MIYLYTPVVLAHLLGEDRSPPPSLWAATLATYDQGMLTAAEALGFPIVDLP